MTKKCSPKSPRILQVRQDRDYDCVYVKGKKIMLGRTGTPEAETAYRQLQIQVFTDPTLSSLKPQQVTVDNLCLAYLQYAKENDPDHYSGIKTAVEILLKHYIGQAVDTLDTRHFLLLQDLFVQHGVSRQYCNMLMNYIRAMLKWGILRKLVPHQVYTLYGEELDIFPGLELERHECFPFFGNFFISLHALVNGLAKRLKVSVKTIVSTLLFDKLPITLHQIQVWRVTRQKDQLHVQ